MGLPMPMRPRHLAREGSHHGMGDCVELKYLCICDILITGIPMSQEPYFVKAFGYVKKAAALANRDLGVLNAAIANAIAAACERLMIM